MDECESNPCVLANVFTFPYPSGCEDIHAGYICHCLPGWGSKTAGDPGECSVDLDECTPDPCVNAASCEESGVRPPSWLRF